jgi:hypothetical protein
MRLNTHGRNPLYLTNANYPLAPRPPRPLAPLLLAAASSPLPITTQELGSYMTGICICITRLYNRTLPICMAFACLVLVGLKLLARTRWPQEETCIFLRAARHCLRTCAG